MIEDFICLLCFTSHILAINITQPKKHRAPVSFEKIELQCVINHFSFNCTPKPYLTMNFLSDFSTYQSHRKQSLNPNINDKIRLNTHLKHMSCFIDFLHSKRAITQAIVLSAEEYKSQIKATVLTPWLC